MEAASARMAARNQFDGYMESPKSTLQRYIYNACDPMSNFEPNLALNLEISDLINSKKGNAPREAAITIVNFINHRNQNIGLLALGLLDICVKNCGYPFHLQISTKEFLNELVRRFPERPPIRSNRVQSKILEAIEEWRQTICQTSRYKEDLGHIRDMHRLLLLKGYMFPEVRREDAAVLNPSDNLKSADEMEEEERAAQSAKLQELIRRGGPEDLQEANRLMKVMAGYDTRHKTDYRAKAAEEVAKVQQKAKILEEMLQSHKEGEKFGEGDVFEELANALRSAHPKIQKMCEEESDDAEAVAKLLEINDSIHRTIERYKLMKSGDLSAAAKIPKGTLGTTTGVGKNAANELSLIDFDIEPPPSQSSNGDLLGGPSQQGAGTTIEDDLLGLSVDDKPFGQTGGIALGFGPPASPLPTSSSFSSMPTTQPRITPVISPAASVQSTRPNYDVFAALTGSRPNSKPATPTPMVQQQRQLPSANPSSVDPFAALIGSSSRPHTPSSQRNGSRPVYQSSSLIDNTAPRSANPAPPAANADEEWDFASSLPEPTLPASSLVQVHASHIRIEFESSRASSQGDIQIVAHFSNETAQSVSALHFKVAVEKGYTLQLRPQSGLDMPPHGRDAIRQQILLHGVPVGKGNLVKMRFKVAYQHGGQTHEEQGHVPPLGIS